MFIPAGALIGLGLGLLLGYAAPGILIGLGLGFLAAALLPQEGAAGTAGSITGSAMQNAPLLLIGIFFVVLGAGILVAPPHFWTYVVPVFLILLGVWLLFRPRRSRS